MKYLLLLNNDGAAVDSWRELSAEEAAARRAEEIPRWNTLFGWAGEQGIDARRPRAGRSTQGARRPRPRRRDDGHRRPVRRDEGADRRLLRRRVQGPRPGDRARAARARRDDRLGRDPPDRRMSRRVPLPRGMGTRRLDPDPRSRRLRARRGRGAGGVRDRGRALAARRDPAQPVRVDRRDRAQPRDRPHPARAHARAEDRAPRPPGGASNRGGRRRELDPRRTAEPRLHVLPSRARARGPRRADPPRGRRTSDPRDRARVPRPRVDARAAARAGEAKDSRRGHPVPRPARPPAHRAPALGARRPLPRLQRGVRRDLRRRSSCGATSATTRFASGSSSRS